MVMGASGNVKICGRIALDDSVARHGRAIA